MPSEINRELFADFQRRQDVTKCFRKTDGKWIIKDIAFVDDWNSGELDEIIAVLKDTAVRSGMVLGAFDGGKLKGFAAVSPDFFGTDRCYLDLSHLFVSLESRRKGIGRELFYKAKDWAKLKGAQKLYISAHSAVESQAFYRAMGCVEAEEYNMALVKKEPCDCQLECPL